MDGSGGNWTRRMENEEWRMICLIIKSEEKGKTN
jgi:hypothetical protein